MKKEVINDKYEYIELFHEYGLLEIFKYLHENSCPLSKGLDEIAEENGYLEILKYLNSI